MKPNQFTSQEKVFYSWWGTPEWQQEMAQQERSGELAKGNARNQITVANRALYSGFNTDQHSQFIWQHELTIWQGVQAIIDRELTQ